MAKRRAVHAVISQGDQLYVVECLELPVVTQGITVDETVSNLREAVALHLEDEDLDDLELASSPTISVTLELEPISLESYRETTSYRYCPSSDSRFTRSVGVTSN